MTTQSQPLILSVSEITHAIKLTLESTYPRVWVKGEISNAKLHTSGHFYFSLKDDFAQISCVCYKGDFMKVALPPKDGNQVLVRAELTVYGPRGSYQLVVKELSHVGIGDQLIKLELLKKKLQALGYFSQERKRPLPRFPKRIGVVTSPTGAVIQDILHILGRRMSGFHLVLNPVRVQGEGAELEIAAAIKQFNDYKLADVLIVGRGGGSFEDLAAFNSEIVATAIFTSQIPIVSAVGHETDFTIADFVADLRAPTPSAAAEIISHEQKEMLDKLHKQARGIITALSKEIKGRRQALLKVVSHPVFSSSSYILRALAQRLDDKGDEVDGAIKRKLAMFQADLQRFKKSLEVVRPSNRIRERKEELSQLQKNLNLSILRLMRTKKQELLAKNSAFHIAFKERYIVKKRAFTSCQFGPRILQLLQKKLQENKRKLENVEAQLDALHPKKILAKGYSIVFSQKDGSVISSISQVHAHSNVRIALVDGELDAEITNVRVKDDKN